MISIKDIPVYLSIAGTIFGGGVFVHDIKRDVVELGEKFQKHEAVQQGIQLRQEKRELLQHIEKYPEDNKAKEKLDEIEEDLKINQQQQQKLKGG